MTRLPEVLNVFFLASKDDFLLHVAAGSTGALRDFTERLSSNAGVACTETSLLFKHVRASPRVSFLGKGVAGAGRASYGTCVGGSGPSTAAGLHGFAAELTSFVGRAAPLGEVAGLLARYRLVTVTGPGGVGKTRLTGQVARAAAGRFADGAWQVELARVSDPGQVAEEVAAVLGVREHPGVPTAGAIVRVLARQQVLLVLDNCEHVVEAAARLCSEILTGCDDVRILATGRAPLRAAGEARYRLAPLELPGPGDPPAASEAVTLFTERARRADARFALTEEATPAVTRLVRRLDGIPLAIELAAAQVDLLGVGQLAERLDDLDWLPSGGDRLGPGRHRSLTATVEWSYALLEGREQRVFRLVSVFAGPFTLEAAEAVAGRDAGAAVLRLVDCCLLVPPQAGPDGRWRYGMLETLRAHGARLLDAAGEHGPAEAALAKWAIRVAEQAEGGLRTVEGDAAAARWLDAEQATMRQVLAWSMTRDHSVTLRLVPGLGWWWSLRGQLAGQCELLREAARHARPGSAEWYPAQLWLSYALYLSGDPLTALDEGTRMRDAAAGQGSSRELADALTSRSGALSELRRYAEAEADARHALDAAREVGYPTGQALALMHLSDAAYYAGDYGRAAQLARQAGQVTGQIPGLVSRSCSQSLAYQLMEAGDLGGAETACTAALASARQAGDQQSLSELLYVMVILDLAAGRLPDATAHVREALQITLRGGDWYALGNQLDCCGLLCAAGGRPAEAVTLWAARAALEHRQQSGADQEDARRRAEPLRKARQALGPGRAQEAEDRGAEMSTQAAAEYALMLTGPAPAPPATPQAGTLSAREAQLIALVAQGCTDAQIAARLHISIRTVNSHLDRIRDKTGCRRRAELTRLALREGLV